MKFILTFYDLYLSRPSTKYFLNLFFLKNNLYFNIKTINYIHIFTKFKKLFIIKIFKFNYTVYLNFIIYFIILNLLIQLFVVILILI
jgi:hypothetical protein